MKNCFGSLSKPLLQIFRTSLVGRVVADNLKIAKVTTIFKTDDVITLTTTNQFPFYHVYLNYFKE